MKEEILNVARDRTARIFHYLGALNQHRNPAKRQIREQPWILWFREIPHHSSICQGTFPEPPNPGSGTVPSSDSEKSKEEFILQVRRPTLTRCPNPPEGIAVWLEQGWEDPSGELRVRKSRNETNNQGDTQLVLFDEDPERLRTLEAWKSRRDEWVQNERPAREAMKLFEQLYGLYGRIQREAESVELVLGDGILSWRRPEGGVYHPVVLQRVQLEFNPSVPAFTVVEAEHEVELYTTLFQSMPEVDGKAVARCRKELEEGGYHPLGGDDASGFFRSLVAQLSPRGEFVGRGAPRGETQDPRIGRDPVLLLRQRTLGFATAVEAVLEDIEHSKDLPRSLLNLVGIAPPVDDSDNATSPRMPWSDPEDVLLSKLANPEQVRIADRLRKHGCVLVQGPPGTGKTHTIANLIGHLLAKGEKVLITAHTSKALRVLREHVVEQLRPMCVSVLESDLESRKQLESSVEAIVERLSISDEQQLEERADQVAAHRLELLRKLEEVRQELLDARADEYREIVLAGKGYTPSDAAREVARESGQHDWIPGPVTLGAPLPLAEGELIDLYRTNLTLSEEDEGELATPLPAPNGMLPPDEFERLVSEREHLANLKLDHRADLWDRPPNSDRAEDLEELADSLGRAVDTIVADQRWRLAAIAAGWSGGSYREPWDRLLAMIQGVCEQAARAQEGEVRYKVILSPHVPLEEQRRLASGILQHLQNGGNLGVFTFLTHPSWKRLVQQTRIAGKEPHLVEHFQSLMDIICLRISRNELCGRWDRQLARLDAPLSIKLGPKPESVCAQFVPKLRDALDWYGTTWKPLQDKLIGLRFRWEAFLAEQPVDLSPHGELLRLRHAVLDPLQAILAARANANRWWVVNETLGANIKTLAGILSADHTAQVTSRLKEAADRLQPCDYREAFKRLADLHNRRTELDRRRLLLGRLESVAPGWASAIRTRQGVHGGHTVPGDPAVAWVWRQLHDELSRRGQVSLEELQQVIERLSADLRRATAEVIDCRAWAAQVRRTTLPQQQALMGWLDTVRKIGKGFGKRAARLRADAARKMTECRTAVPVWIMPLSRVVEHFDPRATRFDVVIIDEASQSDVMALLAFYLGRRIVVVGDHEQVSPAAVGQDLTIVQHLIDEYLEGIPNAILYDGQTSVYDLARQSFGGTICLVEHFRCVPEIIQFSNSLSYEGRIRPLRDPSLVQLKPHVVAHRVVSARSNAKVNWDEVKAVSSLLVAATEQPEYSSKTFGVISLVGEEQALEIERALLRYLPPAEYGRRRIICGNAAHFQGDERDVMFLSLVDTGRGGPLPLRDQQMFKQRFNVAASRARDQMWVVYSVDPRTDLKPGDLRRRLIEHAEDPLALVRALEREAQRAESELEREVLRRLIQAGYRVRSQWQVGHYRIDLAPNGTNAKKCY